jgi:hypothetical protein
MTVTIKRALSGHSWDDVVTAVETNLAKSALLSTEARPFVVFDDARLSGLLRVAVVRSTQCVTVWPWAGLSQVEDGFKYLRVFVDHLADDIARSIKAQLVAVPCATPALECFGCGSPFDQREARWLRWSSPGVSMEKIHQEMLHGKYPEAVPVCPACGDYWDRDNHGSMCS